MKTWQSLRIFIIFSEGKVSTDLFWLTQTQIYLYMDCKINFIIIIRCIIILKEFDVVIIYTTFNIDGEKTIIRKL